MIRNAVTALLAASCLAACAAKPAAESASAKPAAQRVRFVADPFPSTYRRYPSVVTAIRGATVFDGEGGRIENGVVVLADGVVRAVGGANTPIPAGATVIDAAGKWVTPGIIDVHSHLGNYPTPSVEAARKRRSSSE